ncbi:pyruvate dehydrogenase E1 component alpha subunit [Amycolatopsis bartoniae]|uniref:2-oxoisovalerate dehydrogenase subunit alpha n=1 Tax=Amycolatopsis bartoniae TaxID=941986 RepID=A0A8H9IUE4_9PSEU|nr:thiamine pyrophosphate-dependent enzyme [Amycolatopsis bartoniae]MBB2934843.1 pyruvate dehydrogenase E1 component alpha subunit [Amycolatopsis bartoniae]TVT03084.1 pyruvate dehydrogenase [Amycolatopsis bartoniae]GHF44392.1 pyruvate dehydrogenase E1 component alpha subunit [Amycolatopsis bartoniae]
MDLTELYRLMLVTRRLDEEAIALQRQGVLPGYAPMKGQEAAQVGSAAALDRNRDFGFPNYRDLGAAVALGVDLVGYLATHLGVWHGGLYDPRASRLAPFNAVVGGPVPHAVGWAMGAKLDDTRGVALTWFGDGASSQGDVHEAMNFAAVSRLPVVFFCQNNGWAISVPTERQVAGGSVAARAAGYGIEGVRVDGNDVLAVHEATVEAVERARDGGGPTVIEAMTYRMGPHSTSDDPGRYRTLEEEQKWAERDPLIRAAAQLPPETLALAEKHATEVVRQVRDGLQALEQRPGEELFSFVYREPTQALLDQQRAWQEAVDA